MAHTKIIVYLQDLVRCELTAVPLLLTVSAERMVALGAGAPLDRLPLPSNRRKCRCCGCNNYDVDHEGDQKDCPIGDSENKGASCCRHCILEWASPHRMARTTSRRQDMSEAGGHREKLRRSWSSRHWLCCHCDGYKEGSGTSQPPLSPAACAKDGVDDAASSPQLTLPAVLSNKGSIPLPLQPPILPLSEQMLRTRSEGYPPLGSPTVVMLPHCSKGQVMPPGSTRLLPPHASLLPPSRGTKPIQQAVTSIVSTNGDTDNGASQAGRISKTHSFAVGGIPAPVVLPAPGYTPVAPVPPGRGDLGRPGDTSEPPVGDGFSSPTKSNAGGVRFHPTRPGGGVPGPASSLQHFPVPGASISMAVSGIQETTAAASPGVQTGIPPSASGNVPSRQAQHLPTHTSTPRRRMATCHPPTGESLHNHPRLTPESETRHSPTVELQKHPAAAVGIPSQPAPCQATGFHTSVKYEDQGTTSSTIRAERTRPMKDCSTIHSMSMHDESSLMSPRSPQRTTGPGSPRHGSYVGFVPAIPPPAPRIEGMEIDPIPRILDPPPPRQIGSPHDCCGPVAPHPSTEVRTSVDKLPRFPREQKTQELVGTSRFNLACQEAGHDRSHQVLTKEREGSRTSRLSRIESVLSTRIASSSFSGDTKILGERLQTKRVKRPKKVVRADIVARTYRVPEIVHKEEVVEEDVTVTNRIVEVRKPIIREIEIEVPEVDYVQKTIEVPERIVRERIVEKIVPIVQENIIKVPRIQRVEKEMEVVEKEYVERIEEIDIEVPMESIQYVAREVPTKEEVEIPIPEYVNVAQETEIIRNTPIPIEHVTQLYLTFPKIRHSYHQVEFPIYFPRFIEVAHPAEAMESETDMNCSLLIQDIDDLCRSSYEAYGWYCQQQEFDHTTTSSQLRKPNFHGSRFDSNHGPISVVPSDLFSVLSTADSLGNEAIGCQDDVTRGHKAADDIIHLRLDESIHDWIRRTSVAGPPEEADGFSSASSAAELVGFDLGVSQRC